jgi:hypothetical protein
LLPMPCFGIFMLGKSHGPFCLLARFLQLLIPQVTNQFAIMHTSG